MGDNFITVSQKCKKQNLINTIDIPILSQILLMLLFVYILIVFRACILKWFGFTADLPLKLLSSSFQRYKTISLN